MLQTRDHKNYTVTLREDYEELIGFIIQMGNTAISQLQNVKLQLPGINLIIPQQFHTRRK